MIERGERAPDFVLPRGPDAARARFYGHVGGRPTAIVFAGVDPATARRVTDGLDGSCDVHVVVGSDATDDEATWLDPEGGLRSAYGITADAAVVLVDENVRVLAGWPVEEAESTIALVEELLGSRPEARPARVLTTFAPVLLVPDAVSASWCDRLVAAWDAASPEATGVETMADGRRADALDALRKQRRDLVVEDRELLRALTGHVGRRVIPEVTKAFAYDADRFEGFKIGAYDADDAGFFAAHRDNLSPTTAHRAFAMSVNLNDDFEGGELCFPEYGPERYRPARGEALIFSGSLLHEVLPVTRGRRFVLLSFLFHGAT